MEGGEEGGKEGREGSKSKPQRREHQEKADAVSLISRHLVETPALSLTPCLVCHISVRPQGVSYLEIVEVQLAHKGGEVAVSIVSRQDFTLEALRVFNLKTLAIYHGGQDREGNGDRGSGELDRLSRCRPKLSCHEWRSL